MKPRQTRLLRREHSQRACHWKARKPEEAGQEVGRKNRRPSEGYPRVDRTQVVARTHMTTAVFRMVARTLARIHLRYNLVDNLTSGSAGTSWAASTAG